MKPIILCIGVLAIIMLYFPQAAAAMRSETKQQQLLIGVIVDDTTRAGKESKISIEMACHDIKRQTNRSFVPRIFNSQGQPALAALAARNLVDSGKVQVILASHTWEEASRVVEVSNQARIPTFSLAGSTPKWATERWPFLVQASKSDLDSQMKAVAAIVQSWEWYRVTIIYEEDTDSAFGRAIPDLFEALKEVGAQIINLVPLPPFITSSLSEDLLRLKNDQNRVFVVHTSMEMAVSLFQTAKEMQMMEKGYVWIVTNTIADLVHSLNVSTISTMQGVLGVKTYFPENTVKYLDLKKRLSKKFSLEYSEEENNETGISAMEAYDALWAVALTLDDGNVTWVPSQGEHFLEKLSLIDLNGMTGRVHYNARKLLTSNTFEVINVIGKSYRELGVWSEGLGFSKSINDKGVYNSSMEILGQVFWPGESMYTPRGWSIPTSSNYFLRIGVPSESMFKQFVSISYDPQTNNYSCNGFAIDIFKAAMQRMPYYVPYEFFPHNGTYDSLVEKVYLKEFDAAVGDIGVIAERCQYAEFTHTYTNSALVMLVPVQSEMANNAWLFMKPFTNVMWLLIFAITIYNGFVVWLIERKHCEWLRGSMLDEAGILIWLSFSTLFSLNGGKLNSNLSRMTVVVWLFVALVITQSYTASLTSMLTLKKLEPKVADIETLKNNNAMVGYAKGAFVARYVEDVLGFKPENVKKFSSAQEYAQALKSGEIAAGFLNAPYVKLFLAKYCKSFIAAGPTYKIGGYGFAFPKGSPMIADVNKALLEVFESGKLRELEDKMVGAEKCVEVESTSDEDASFSLNSFWILFALTGGTTTFALTLYVLASLKNTQCSFLQKIKFFTNISNHWRLQRRRFSRKVSDAEIPTHLPPMASNTEIRLDMSSSGSWPS